MERNTWLVALGLGATLAGIPSGATHADDVLAGPNAMGAPGQLVLEVTYIPDDDPPAPSMSPWAVGWHLGCSMHASQPGAWHGRVRLANDAAGRPVRPAAFDLVLTPDRVERVRTSSPSRPVRTRGVRYGKCYLPTSTTAVVV